MVDHLPGHLGGIGLDDGELRARIHAPIEAPGRLVGHESRRMNAGGGIGDPPLNRLAIGQIGAEGFSLRRVLDHHVERPLRAADAPGSHLHPTRSEPLLHRRKALAFDAKQLAGRNAAIIEGHLGGEDAAQHRNHPGDLEARRALVDDEGRDAAALATSAIGAGHDDAEVGTVHVADPDLAAVDHPVAAIANRTRGHARRITARTRLGDDDG